MLKKLIQLESAPFYSSDYYNWLKKLSHQLESAPFYSSDYLGSSIASDSLVSE